MNFYSSCNRFGSEKSCTVLLHLANRCISWFVVYIRPSHFSLSFLSQFMLSFLWVFISLLSERMSNLIAHRISTIECRKFRNHVILWTWAGLQTTQHQQPERTEKREREGEKTHSHIHCEVPVCSHFSFLYNALLHFTLSKPTHKTSVWERESSEYMYRFRRVFLPFIPYWTFNSASFAIQWRELCINNEMMPFSSCCLIVCNRIGLGSVMHLVFDWNDERCRWAVPMTIPRKQMHTH